MFSGVELLAVASGCLQTPRVHSMSKCVCQRMLVCSIDEGHRHVPNVVSLATNGSHQPALPHLAPFHRLVPCEEVSLRKAVGLDPANHEGEYQAGVESRFNLTLLTQKK